LEDLFKRCLVCHGGVRVEDYTVTHFKLPGK
jgi:hypothetical protein